MLVDLEHVQACLAASGSQREVCDCTFSQGCGELFSQWLLPGRQEHPSSAQKGVGGKSDAPGSTQGMVRTTYTHIHVPVAREMLGVERSIADVVMTSSLHTRPLTDHLLISQV
jgi:hypothetical protein